MAAFLICAGTVAAQEIGEVTTVDLAGGTATVTLDFTARDYELILFPVVTNEEDSARTFSYTVSGSGVSAKPAIRRMPPAKAFTESGRIKALLREEERVLADLLEAVGGWHPSMGKIAEPTQIGSVRTFTYAGFKGTEEDVTVQATLVATSTRAVAYVDNATVDTVKITTSDIQEMLETFSTVSYPTVTQTFGEGSDVDGDGKVLFLFTQLVDAEEFVAGFYRASSLFTDANGGDGNVADMIYIGFDSSRDFYDPMLAHEFQHLVNYNQHVLISSGSSEDSWLNEALSHYAEDLVNGHVAGQMNRLYGPLLEGPENYSLTGPAGTNNGIRGTAYLFLRGLVREFGETVATQLVQTSLSGVENVEQATGKQIDELLASHVSRLFLSGTGLNSVSKYNYAFPFFTEPTTGQRSLPMPFETGFSANGTPVTGQVKPAAPAYLRMMGEGASVSVGIETEATGNFRAILIPIPQDFRPQRALKGDYFPGLTFDDPIQGQYTSGEPVRISGSLSDQTLDRLLFRFQTTGEDPDTIRFYTDVVSGQFDRRIVLHPSHAGDYELEIFTGKQDEGLDFSGRFSSVFIVEGSADVQLPADYFSGFALDSKLAADHASGEAFRFSGSVDNDATTQLSLKLTSLDRPEKNIQFSVRVFSGRFDRTLVFHPSHAGSYMLELFAGEVGESKPLVDGFYPITVTEGSGSVELPTGYFDFLALDNTIPTTNSSDDAIALKGSVADQTINQLFLRLAPLETGRDTLEFFTDVKAGAFNRSIAVHPSQAGLYELGLFAGQRGESKPLAGEFTPFTITQGGESFTLPPDFISSISFDPPLPGAIPSGESFKFSGTGSDPSVTQMLLRFEPLSGLGDSIRVFIDIENGQFDYSEIFGTPQEGEYKLVFFAGLQDESLSFVDSFAPISIVEGSGELFLPMDFFDGITLDSPFAADQESGKAITLSGSVEDATVTQLLVRFEPTDISRETIDFFPGVRDGRFSRSIVFTAEQAGQYEVKVYAGQRGGAKAFVRSFIPITIGSGPTPTKLPVDYFDSLTLDEPIAATYRAGDPIPFSGQVSDTSVDQMLLEFKPDDGGATLSFRSSVVSGQFRSGLVFTASQVETYTMNLFGRQPDGSFNLMASFSDFRVTATGFEQVNLPVAALDGIVLDAPLPADYSVNQSVQVSGAVTDQTVTQILFRFDPVVEGAEQVLFWVDVSGGTFSQAFTFTAEQTGDYKLNLFGGLAGEGLPFRDSFTTIRVSSGPRLVVRQPSLDFGDVSLGGSGTATIVIVNRGNETLSVTQVTLDNAQFSISLDPFNLAGGDSVTATLTFTPGGTGDVVGNLILTSNDPLVSTAQIALTGTGSEVAQVLQPKLTMRTTSLLFGTIAVGGSATQSFLIVNSGTDTLKVDNVTGAREPFSTALITVIPVFVIAPGDSVTVQVSFEPGSAGDYTGVLTLSGNVADVVVTLSGSATTSTPVSGKVGDFNEDGQVDFSDFIQFAGAFGMKPGDARYNTKFDLDGNEDIGFRDFLIFASNYGK